MVGFGEDPDAGAIVKRLGPDDPETVRYGESILHSVFGADRAPVAMLLPQAMHRRRRPQSGAARFGAGLKAPRSQPARDRRGWRPRGDGCGESQPPPRFT